jgi:LysR family transcriptional regulator for bpeEF and oprC
VAFAHRGVKFSVPVSGRLNVNNSEALHRRRGAGPRHRLGRDLPGGRAIKAGQLKVVMRDFVTLGPPVSAVYLPTRHLSARVTAFLEFLASAVPAEPAWDRTVLGR